MTTNDSTTGAAPLQIRTDADMNFTIQGFKNTTLKGDIKMGNKLFTIISFDDITEEYKILGTTNSDINPQEVLELIGKGDDTTEFDNVISDLFNFHVAEILSLADAKLRSSNSRMTRAEHTPIVMRKGEWSSMLFALEYLRTIDAPDATSNVAYGVSYSKLIDIIKQQSEKALDVVVS